MAKKKVNTVKATDVVQVPLLPEHTDAVEAKVVEVSDALLDLFKLLREGYNLTFSYDQEREQTSIRLGGITENQPFNEGKLLYANGDTDEIAIAALWVKHFLVSKGGEWVSVSNKKRGFS